MRSQTIQGMPFSTERSPTPLTWPCMQCVYEFLLVGAEQHSTLFKMASLVWCWTKPHPVLAQYWMGDRPVKKEIKPSKWSPYSEKIQKVFKQVCHCFQWLHLFPVFSQILLQNCNLFIYFSLSWSLNPDKYDSCKGTGLSMQWVIRVCFVVLLKLLMLKQQFYLVLFLK